MAEEHMAKRARTDKPLGRRPRGEYRTRVIVKFRDHVQLPYDRTAQSRIEPLGIGPWDRLAAEFKGITLTPLFTSKQPEDIHALVDRATATDPTYRPPNFLTYFAVNIPVGSCRSSKRWTSVDSSPVATRSAKAKMASDVGSVATTPPA
jgi:hypothetical protein